MRMNTATDVIFHLGRNAARADEVEGMMAMTGTDSLSALIRKLRTIREDVILGLWSLRYSGTIGTKSYPRKAAKA